MVWTDWLCPPFDRIIGWSRSQHGVHHRGNGDHPAGAAHFGDEARDRLPIREILLLEPASAPRRLEKRTATDPLINSRP
jgi:hypothetical protein